MNNKTKQNRLLHWTHAGGLCSSEGDSGMEAKLGSWLTTELILKPTAQVVMIKKKPTYLTDGQYEIDLPHRWL